MNNVRLAGASVLLACGALTTVGLLAPGSAQSAPTSALAAAPEVYHGFDNLDTLPSMGSSSNSLLLPEGAFSVHAKAYVNNQGSAPSGVECRLSVGSNFDIAAAGTAQPIRTATVALQVVNESSTARFARLVCTNRSANPVTLRHIKITGTRVNAVPFHGEI